MNHKYKKDIFAIIIFVLIYVILSNARGASQNPYEPTVVMNITTIVPILAGLLISWRTGLFTGLIAPIVNFSITTDIVGIYMTVPYAITGVIAGHLSKKIPSPLIALLVIPLVILLYALKGALNAWEAIAYEAFSSFITIVVISTIYRISFKDATKHK